MPITTRLIILFEQWADEKLITISQLPPSGSYRTYFRITGKTQSVLGAVNCDIKENRAFIEYSRFFRKKGLPVPEVYAVDESLKCYLLEDLGNTTLFDRLSILRTGSELPSQIVDFYHSVLPQLIRFQIEGRSLDFLAAYPRAKFDKQSMMWDLHYFKYYFLKLAQIPFDEQLLEDDFNRFTDFLLETDTDYFLYRDFQSRNIMVVDGKPAFIDYQGGRKGALQYDIASLLFDAKADLPNEIREELFNAYISELKKHIAVDESKFKEYYYGYVLIRIMQAMGAYGFRGFYEKKTHFLKSIPFALQNLRFVLNNASLPVELPALKGVLTAVINSGKLIQIASEPELCVTITSFSYKRGIPVDYSGHGGGFVFDCRSLPNPGKYAEYKTKTGKDAEVIAFLEKEQEVKSFLTNVFAIVEQSVNKYIKRSFKHLMVSFGCTGGQHRSVYSAEQLAAHLSKKFPVQIKLNHVELEMAENTK
ncbi:MAG: phosphotransferase [Cytophagaceae bacterium]|nr:phosphotransferase [Cytophagaceae bacterium]